MAEEKQADWRTQRAAARYASKQRTAGAPGRLRERMERTGLTWKKKVERRRPIEEDEEED